MFPTDFLMTGCVLDEALARALVAWRNQYAYPRAYMAYTSEPSEFELAPGVWAKPVEPDEGVVTDVALDSYHRRLLTSANSGDNLLGSLSVIYWGFYSSSPGRAFIRALRHLKGYKSVPATTPASIGQALTSVRRASDAGEALGALAGLSQLGRTPFASKVVAHCLPEIAGVCDGHTTRGVLRSQWGRHAAFAGPVGPVWMTTYQTRFREWCTFLVHLALQLNAGIDRGAHWAWLGTELSPQRWRAIDVERALFRYFQLELRLPRVATPTSAGNDRGGCVTQAP